MLYRGAADGFAVLVYSAFRADEYSIVWEYNFGRSYFNRVRLNIYEFQARTTVESIFTDIFNGFRDG